MRYHLESRSEPAILFDRLLQKFIMKSFGWIYDGQSVTSDPEVETTYEVDSFDKVHEKTRVNHHFRRYMDFVRVNPYHHNAIFGLLELVCRVVSFVRRLAIRLMEIGAIVLIVLALFEAVTTVEAGNLILQVLLAYLKFILAPSLICPIAAMILRKAFNMDQKVKDDLRANGYKPEWENWK